MATLEIREFASGPSFARRLIHSFQRAFASMTFRYKLRRTLARISQLDERLLRDAGLEPTCRDSALGVQLREKLRAVDDPTSPAGQMSSMSSDHANIATAPTTRAGLRFP